MANPARFFDKYKELIPDYELFAEKLVTDAPDHVRVNPARATAQSVSEFLAAKGLSVSPEPWFPDLLRVEGKGPKRLGSTLLHALGHYYIQSASSAVSALALKAAPGDQVLDLCAAPGSKTTLIAQAVGNEGCVAANEPSAKRLTSLVANIRRLGLTNVLVTAYMGQNFPVRFKFDRILVDAPCSGEGTWRGRDARPRPMSPGQRDGLTMRQSAILNRAVEALKPGGTLIYSTCTYAPEENELVVAKAVEKYGMEVVPLDLDIPFLPGLTQWEGKELPACLARSARLYPHLFDSEGFFVARMVKPD